MEGMLAGKEESLMGLMVVTVWWLDGLKGKLFKLLRLNKSWTAKKVDWIIINFCW